MDINSINTLSTHTDLAGMALHPAFISEVKKEKSTKKKNEHGDICFLIKYKFLCKISFKLISFCFCSYIV